VGILSSFAGKKPSIFDKIEHFLMQIARNSLKK